MENSVRKLAANIMVSVAAFFSYEVSLPVLCVCYFDADNIHSMSAIVIQLIQAIHKNTLTNHKNKTKRPKSN